MSEAPFVEMILLCGTAAGLILLAAAKATLGGRTVPVRLAAAAGCALAAGALPAAVGFPVAAMLPIGVVIAVALAWTAASSPYVASALLRLQARSLHSGFLAAAGGVLFVGSVARFEIADSAAADLDTAFMMEVTWKPPLSVVTEVTAVTDRGRPVSLHRPTTAREPGGIVAAERRVIDSVRQADGVIRTGPAADEFNCHGWVFSDGRYWVTPGDVDYILADNGYQAVSQPRPGDLVVYRERERITHTGLVRTGGDGGPLLVESKWGWLGRFLHPPGGTCYGRSFTYYRSPRAGHLLTGLRNDSVAAAQPVAAAAVQH